jgi:hypothetical protein
MKTVLAALAMPNLQPVGLRCVQATPCSLISCVLGCFLILPNQTVLVGRDEARNHVAFADPVVSRSQLEIFSIIVDDEYSHPPLVFVRDRGSSNGTAVNGQIIGKGAKLTASRLLEDGDIITIGPHPHLRLRYTRLANARPSYSLSHLQRREVKVRNVL